MTPSMEEPTSEPGAQPEPRVKGPRRRIWPFRKRRTASSTAREQGTDIASRRNRPAERIWRIVRRFRFVILAGVLALWAYADPRNLNILLILLGFVGQLVFILLYVVIQFGAIFWFVSRTRTVMIKPGDSKSVTFGDYWGQPALLALVRQWISLLSDRDKFVEMGGQYINGLLLYGEPGTGKTMLAKAMAGEAGIAFLSMEGSSFRGMFWGMDTLKMISFVRKARNLAREYGACIAYIDEIDAVAQSRSGVMGQGGMGMMGGMMGGMMMNGALTRLLYEMDGIGEPSFMDRVRARLARILRRPAPVRNWHVLFMGSTNRPDILDPALLRPGRFDQVIKVDRPDRVGRRAIVTGYLSRIRHDPAQIDVEAIVSDTPKATPAQIMSAITKDAVRRAIFQGREFIIQDDVDQAIQEQLVGMANPIEEMDPLQLREIAYHEAGHAVIQHYIMPDQRISRVSVIRRSSGALGYVLPVDTVEIYGEPLRRIVADIMVSLAGHVAVKVFMGEFWTGAWSDYAKVRWNLRNLAMLGFFGPPVFELALDPQGLRFKDERVEKVWVQLEEQVEQRLTEHADEVEAIAEALLAKKELTNSEVLALLGKNSLQLARSQGQEMESVLEHMGVSPQGLSFRRRTAEAERQRVEAARSSQPTPPKDPEPDDPAK